MASTAIPPGVRERVLRLATAGLDWKAFCSQAVGRVAAVVGSDTWCVATADPSTLLMTGVFAEGRVGAVARFFELEYGEDDFLPQRDLARTPPHAGALGLATEFRLDRSVLWRELLEPFGLGDQLRAALVVDDRCWGYLALMRERSGAPFRPADVRAVSEIASAIATGLRNAGVGAAAPRAAHSFGPAVVMLAQDFSVVAVTPSAAALLGEDLSPGDLPPAAVLAVAARACAVRPLASQSVSVRARGPTGWVELWAAPVRSSAAAVAVTIERARPAEILDLLAATWGLTAREAEITRLVLAGRSTSEMAETLHVSPLTVQQHLKSIFTKLGVRSRREVVGRVFAEHYLPQAGASTDL